MEEHFEAQSRYADLLFKGLNITWLHPIKRIIAFKAAEDFRESHRKCCEWADEQD
jgi:hypothetical protein